MDDSQPIEVSKRTAILAELRLQIRQSELRTGDLIARSLKMAAETKALLSQLEAGRPPGALPPHKDRDRMVV